ncbi:MULTISPECIES: ABC transporter ATP-binding protein [Caproicibacterium]|jgi:ATP-binding cassette subfamily B multidrug efflux pump|uniref:ATP-binding cassette domain-containing protein n=1 Tax=Caproicibacterium lactatifermentans TaxID=2666138 RepID=A0A859DP85_9FIRM|nr:ABC transporter ATP-binding protein [Caproicibacterium lactatifermentans]ARP50929.1 multidrug ABC transporter ATP-binding protein [Ruminococcaceae bacterium CPB6]MDD4807607.1 ABC transporter ATP-binding protein [Oscillospiraceae bacterium]QKN23344.1 ATP-binding cassette domain-containing protein [Caproicibacterium lactatifermentans]QKO29975.1 ATP-binding cassette domain-containing protein [Caproicibacterium lactatifermentans]
MKLIFKYLGHYKGWCLLDFLSVFGFALTELGIPTLMAKMIDGGVMKNDTGYIHKMWLTILIISFIGVTGIILLGYCCARISSNVTADMRSDVFARAQSFSDTEFGKFGVSSMITRTNNDAFQVQMFLNMLLRTALMTPVMLVASYVMILYASVKLSLIVAATIPIIVLGVVIVARLSKPISEKQQDSQDGMNRITRENLTGIRVVRAFTNDKYEEKRFAGENEQYASCSKKMFLLMQLTQPAFFLIMNIASVLIYWRGAQLLGIGQLQIGQLTAFVVYLFHAMMSTMLFCTVFMMYPRAAVSAHRIQQVLDTVPLVRDPVGGLQMQKPVRDLTFDHVTFVYPDGDEPVLQDVSFSVRVGQTIAFVGSTGSGKSTLVNLIPRFYDVTGGSIQINGTDIREYSLSSLRGAMGFIPQKAFLFHGTIADNIRFGKEDASKEEVEHAAKVAQAYDFIMEKPGGFDETIEENSVNTSGGQRQRLSIARAVVRQPQIYVFDDSFSALDFRTDANLRRALHSETQNAIVAIVAQRVSTILDADCIVVLNEGKVVGMGTHQQLLRTCPIYYEIAASQLTEAELQESAGEGGNAE